MFDFIGRWYNLELIPIPYDELELKYILHIKMNL